MDFSGYKASSATLGKLQGVDFVAVVGPTAVGKSSLMAAATQRDSSITNILTQTSRTPRPDERDGVDIHFRSKEEMLTRIDRREYVQVAPSLLGDIYATGPEDYPIQGVGLLAVLADAVSIFRALPFKSFRVVFVVPPSFEVWQERIKVHGFDPERLAKRMAEAKRSFTYALNNPDVVCVINDDINAATTDFMSAAIGEQLGPRQIANQDQARLIIRSILTKL